MQEEVTGVCQRCGHPQTAILEGGTQIIGGYLPFDYMCDECGGRLYTVKDLPRELVCESCGAKQEEVTRCRIVGMETIEERGSFAITCDQCGGVFDLGPL
jgi:hypothetical protein